MTDIEQRLGRIEQRLANLERLSSRSTNPLESKTVEPAEQVTASDPRSQATAAPDMMASSGTEAPPGTLKSPPLRTRRVPVASTSMLMAWGAAASFLLAAGYFIMLAYEWGWLTPIRQLLISFAAGVGLIAGGIVFASRDRQYAAYMPAVGLAVLYFTIYAGHLYYGLVPVSLAVVIVGGISLAGIALGWRFGNSVFTVLAAIGVYLTPILIQASFADVTGIVIYFSVWSLMFSFIALQEGRRITYLIALYLALLAFDAAWRISGSKEWEVACVYQLVQFLIFSGTAVIFSIRHRAPMDDTTALLHGIPLFYFYALEFILLKEYAPALVAPVALASVVVVLGLYLAVQRRGETLGSLAASSGLVSAYCAFVTGHIVFIELLPEQYFAWGALLLPLVIGMLQRQFDWSNRVAGPMMLVGGLLFLAGFVLTLLRLDDVAEVTMPNLALVLYGLVLYSMAYLSRDHHQFRALSAVALYMGHLAIMVATVRVFDSGLTISVIWAGCAVGLLLLALKTNSRHLGQSSLIIFTASAVKVLLFDLAGSAPLIRIGTLVVLGGSLYVGGWLYQNLVRATATLHPDPEIDAQVKIIRQLVDQGFDNLRIVRQLVRQDVACKKEGGWTEELVAEIRREFALDLETDPG